MGLAALTALTACTAGGGEDSSPTLESSTTVARSLPPGEDRTIPEGDEPEVLGPLGETEVEFETDEGMVQIGSGDVPDAVAASFPIPDGLEVELASQSGEDAGFSGLSDLGFDELVEFYETRLVEAGYEFTSTRFTSGVVAVYEFAGPDGSGSLAISTAPGGGRNVLVVFSG